MAGRIQSLCDEVQRLGIPIDTLPVWYMGLPLTTKSMTHDDNQPLIDKIRTQLLSWSIRALFHASRLQVINSVIVSRTNFWCSVIRLPKCCLEKIERTCSVFLLYGSPNSNKQEKVAWNYVCKHKTEGGLGIRRMADYSRLFSLSLIWRLLINSGSFVLLELRWISCGVAAFGMWVINMQAHGIWRNLSKI